MKKIKYQYIILFSEIFQYKSGSNSKQNIIAKLDFANSVFISTENEKDLNIAFDFSCVCYGELESVFV